MTNGTRPRLSARGTARVADEAPTDDEEHAMPQGPDLTKFIEAGMNFTELRRSQARQAVAELVAQGQLAREQAASTVDEMLEASRRRREDLRSFVQTEIQRQVRALGIATRDDLERLERKLAAKSAPGKRAPAKKTAAKKRATKTTSTTTTKTTTAAPGRV
jgi:polyhydroxyalkanoate synthesis regulator phasin